MMYTLEETTALWQKCTKYKRENRKILNKYLDEEFQKIYNSICPDLFQKELYK